MRKITILLLLTAFGISLYAQQITNAGFEQWSNQTEAQGWNSINSLLVAPGVQGFAQTTDAYSGQYAGLLSSINEFGSVVPGVLTLGQVEMGNVSGGIPFAHQPNSLSFYFKHPTQGNTQVHLMLTRYQSGQRDTIAYGNYIPGPGVDTYTKAYMNIHYFANLLPDSLNIVFVTDMQNAGDSLYIDELTFDYPTAIHSSVGEANQLIYPNPGTGTFYLRKMLDCDLIIYSLQGQQVAKIEKGRQVMHLQFLSKGLYLVKSEDGSHVYKLRIM